MRLLTSTELRMRDILNQPSDGEMLRRRPAQPTPAQDRLVRAAVRDAGAAGLRCHAFTVRYVEGDGGCAVREQTGPKTFTFRMIIGVDVCPNELVRVVLHECQHLADMADGTWDRLELADLEYRAIDFSNALTARTFRKYASGASPSW